MNTLFKKTQAAGMNKGFTLVETLVAIFILTIAIVTPLSVAYQGIAATNLAKNKLTAQFLAQDAAEYLLARQTEDSQNWLNNFSSSCTSSDGCALDTNLFSVSPGNEGSDCSGGICSAMYENTSTGEFCQSATGACATPTLFTRRITLKSLNSDNPGEVQVTVTVGWSPDPSHPDPNKTFILRVNYYQ